MKKMIQIFSLLSLMFVFTAVGAFAQTGFGTEVEIPFAFNVGERSYDGGNYIVKVSKQATGVSLLSIQDTKTDDTQYVLLNSNGDAPLGSDVKLVFATIGDRKFLTKVDTPGRGYSIREGKAEKEARSAKGASVGAPSGGGANLF